MAPKQPKARSRRLPELSKSLRASGVCRVDAENVAECIGIPTSEWPGSCYAIAVAILDAGLMKGKARYGRYSGEIAPGTLFDRDIPAFLGSQHGWAENRIGTRIVDPTRYVFEGDEPYVYVGPCPGEDYDIGGQTLRDMMRQPCPPADPKQPQFDVELSEDAYKHFTERTGLPHPSYSSSKKGEWYFSINLVHLSWLANASLTELGPHAEEFYDELRRLNLLAWVPIDLQNFVYGGPHDND